MKLEENADYGDVINGEYTGKHFEVIVRNPDVTYSGLVIDDCWKIRSEIISRVNSHEALVKALERSQELFEKALPKFNWGSSYLNAEAIKLLNDVPLQVNAALALAEKGETS